MTNLTKNIKHKSYINLYNRFIEMANKIHYTQLDTILMVEETIQKMNPSNRTSKKKNETRAFLN